MKFTAFLIAAAFALTGCQTINFTNGKVTPPENYPQTEWHQIGVLHLVEFGDPLDLSKECSNGWDAVQTRQNVGQVFIDLGIGFAWSPREINIECKTR